MLAAQAVGAARDCFVSLKSEIGARRIVWQLNVRGMVRIVLAHAVNSCIDCNLAEDDRRECFACRLMPRCPTAIYLGCVHRGVCNQHYMQAVC